MALFASGTEITRVSVGGVFVKTVVQNGTTVFNLSDWTYLGTTGSYTVGLGTYSYGNYAYPSDVPTGQLSSFLTTSYPVQNYGAGVVGRVSVFAYIFDIAAGNFVYTFIRYEFYKVTQTVVAPVYTWQYVDVYSSDPGFEDFFFEGTASNTGDMISVIQNNAPASIYPGTYAVFYNYADYQYYVFYSTT